MASPRKAIAETQVGGASLTPSKIARARKLLACITEDLARLEETLDTELTNIRSSLSLLSRKIQDKDN